MADVQHEANIAVEVRSYDQPMLRMVVVGVWVGAGRYWGTNLLLRGVIELYPDLLLGRRGVIMKNEHGRWRTDKYWTWGCRAVVTKQQHLFWTKLNLCSILSLMSLVIIFVKSTLQSLNMSICYNEQCMRTILIDKNRETKNKDNGSNVERGLCKSNTDLC